jgi:hypothetical protein
MRDLQLNLLLDLGRHVPMRFIHSVRCPVEQIKIDNHASQGCVSPPALSGAIAARRVSATS